MSGLRRRDKAGNRVAEKNADEICLLNFTHKVCFRMGNVCHEQVPGLMPLNIKFIWRSFSNLTVPRTPYRKRRPSLLATNKRGEGESLQKSSWQYKTKSLERILQLLLFTPRSYYSWVIILIPRHTAAGFGLVGRKIYICSASPPIIHPPTRLLHKLNTVCPFARAPRV